MYLCFNPSFADVGSFIFCDGSFYWSFLVAGITCLLELFVTGLLIEIVFLRVLSLIFFIDLSYSWVLLLLTLFFLDSLLSSLLRYDLPYWCLIFCWFFYWLICHWLFDYWLSYSAFYDNRWFLILLFYNCSFYSSSSLTILSLATLWSFISCFPFEISFFHCGPFDILGLWLIFLCL